MICRGFDSLDHMIINSPTSPHPTTTTLSWWRIAARLTQLMHDRLHRVNGAMSQSMSSGRGVTGSGSTSGPLASTNC